MVVGSLHRALKPREVGRVSRHGIRHLRFLTGWGASIRISARFAV
jgi:hypothetical protein